MSASLDDDAVLNQSIILRGVLATLLKGTGSKKKAQKLQDDNNDGNDDEDSSSDDDDNLYEYHDDSDTNLLLVTSDDDDDNDDGDENDHGSADEDEALEESESDPSDNGDDADDYDDDKHKKEVAMQKNYKKIKKMQRHRAARLRRVQAAFVQQPIYPSVVGKGTRLSDSYREACASGQHSHGYPRDGGSGSGAMNQSDAEYYSSRASAGHAAFPCTDSFDVWCPYRRTTTGRRGGGLQGGLVVDMAESLMAYTTLLSKLPGGPDWQGDANPQTELERGTGGHLRARDLPDILVSVGRGSSAFVVHELSRITGLPYVLAHYHGSRVGGPPSVEVRMGVEEVLQGGSASGGYGHHYQQGDTNTPAAPADKEGWWLGKIPPGSRALVVLDVLRGGATAAALTAAVFRSGGMVAGVVSVAELLQHRGRSHPALRSSVKIASLIRLHMRGERTKLVPTVADTEFAEKQQKRRLNELKRRDKIFGIIAEQDSAVTTGGSTTVVARGDYHGRGNVVGPHQTSAGINKGHQHSNYAVMAVQQGRTKRRQRQWDNTCVPLDVLAAVMGAAESHAHNSALQLSKISAAAATSHHSTDYHPTITNTNTSTNSSTHGRTSADGYGYDMDIDDSRREQQRQQEEPVTAATVIGEAVQEQRCAVATAFAPSSSSTSKNVFQRIKQRKQQQQQNSTNNNNTRNTSGGVVDAHLLSSYIRGASNIAAVVRGEMQYYNTERRDPGGLVSTATTDIIHQHQQQRGDNNLKINKNNKQNNASSTAAARSFSINNSSFYSASSHHTGGHHNHDNTSSLVLSSSSHHQQHRQQQQPTPPSSVVDSLGILRKLFSGVLLTRDADDDDDEGNEAEEQAAAQQQRPQPPPRKGEGLMSVFAAAVEQKAIRDSTLQRMLRGVPQLSLHDLLPPVMHPALVELVADAVMFAPAKATATHTHGGATTTHHQPCNNNAAAAMMPPRLLHPRFRLPNNCDMLVVFQDASSPCSPSVMNNMLAPLVAHSISRRLHIPFCILQSKHLHPQFQAEYLRKSNNNNNSNYEQEEDQQENENAAAASAAVHINNAVSGSVILPGMRCVILCDTLLPTSFGSSPSGGDVDDEGDDHHDIMPQVPVIEAISRRGGVPVEVVCLVEVLSSQSTSSSSSSSSRPPSSATPTSHGGHDGVNADAANRPPLSRQGYQKLSAQLSNTSTKGSQQPSSSAFASCPVDVSTLVQLTIEPVPPAHAARILEAQQSSSSSRSRHKSVGRRPGSSSSSSAAAKLRKLKKTGDGTCSLQRHAVEEGDGPAPPTLITHAPLTRIHV